VLNLLLLWDERFCFSTIHYLYPTIQTGEAGMREESFSLFPVFPYSQTAKYPSSLIMKTRNVAFLPFRDVSTDHDCRFLAQKVKIKGPCVISIVVGRLEIFHNHIYAADSCPVLFRESRARRVPRNWSKVKISRPSVALGTILAIKAIGS
jgi:hypothetical protein